MTGSVVRCFAVLTGPCIVLAIPLFALGASAPPHAKFHAPQSEPERALDSILKRVDKDENLLDNLLQGRGTKNYKPTFDYASLLTSGLIAAIRTKEREIVRRDCRGKYVEGDICGLDYSPITCAQDMNSKYEYRTLENTGDAVKIEYRWPPGGKPVATYTLRKNGTDWKIDGISCAGASAFNMH
jgi:hypothetical protein